VLGLIGLLAAVASAAQAAGGQLPSGAQRAQERITQEVRHELLSLPQFGIFDNLEFMVNGSTVTLMGEVRTAFLKDAAEKVVQRVEGVEQVKNQIEVLPASATDERIRLAVARALFDQDSPLLRYSMGAVPSLHIIVKNGRVTLEGVVASQTDKNLAFMRANGIHGVFSVENHLQVQKD